MNCEECQNKVGAYVDGELSSDEMRNVGDHVRTCTECAALGMEIASGKRAFKVAAPRFAPSPEFRRKIEAQVAGRKQFRFAAWLVPALAVLMLLVAGSIFVVRSGARDREQVMREVADLHVSSLASASPVDVVSTDRHTVKPWFQGKLPFTFNLPELNGTPFTLEGGRMAYLGQSPAAHLIYRIRQHRMSVFIVQQPSREFFGTGPVQSQKTSFTTESWAQDGLGYYVVGDAAPGDIAQLAALLRSAAQPAR